MKQRSQNLAQPSYVHAPKIRTCSLLPSQKYSRCPKYISTDSTLPCTPPSKLLEIASKTHIQVIRCCLPIISICICVIVILTYHSCITAYLFVHNRSAGPKIDRSCHYMYVNVVATEELVAVCESESEVISPTRRRCYLLSPTKANTRQSVKKAPTASIKFSERFLIVIGATGSRTEMLAQVLDTRKEKRLGDPTREAKKKERSK
jgi:hypothetical protein